MYLNRETVIHPLYVPDIETSGTSFFIKRDDLIHPFISGNKWRKLKGLVEAPEFKNTEHFITMGGAFSNHLLALAAYGSIAGVKTTGLIRGEIVEPLNEHLFWCKYWGMELIPVSRSDFRDVETLRGNFESGLNTCFIPEGGATQYADVGFQHLVDELPEYFEHIVIAVGTGTSAMMLAKALEKREIKSKVWGIVVMKTSSFSANLILEKPANLTWVLNNAVGRYGYASNDILEFGLKLSRKNGIVFDPVYTAKALFVTRALALDGVFKQNKKVLFIHSGGSFGVSGFKTQYSSMF